MEVWPNTIVDFWQIIVKSFTNSDIRWPVVGTKPPIFLLHNGADSCIGAPSVFFPTTKAENTLDMIPVSFKDHIQFAWYWNRCPRILALHLLRFQHVTCLISSIYASAVSSTPSPVTPLYPSILTIVCINNCSSRIYRTGRLPDLRKIRMALCFTRKSRIFTFKNNEMPGKLQVLRTENICETSDIFPFKSWKKLLQIYRLVTVPVHKNLRQKPDMKFTNAHILTVILTSHRSLPLI